MKARLSEDILTGSSGWEGVEGKCGETKSAEGEAGIGPGPGSRGAREKGGRSASLGVGPGRMKGHSLGCGGRREEQLGMLGAQ